jgi:hypothetical protein
MALLDKLFFAINDIDAGCGVFNLAAERAIMRFVFNCS